MNTVFVQVGNTHTVFACVDGVGVWHKQRLLTVELQAEIGARHEALCAILEGATACCLTGVAPQWLAYLQQMLPVMARIPVVLLRHEVMGLFENPYSPPESLGMDRLCKLAALARLNPTGDSVAVDMGTAITVDVLLSGRRFAGGMIMPGEQACYSALYHSTALLPDLQVGEGALLRPGLGLNTVDCIRHGVSNMVLGAMERVLRDLLQKHPQAEIFFTGGGARAYLDCLRAHFPLRYADDLVLDGMALLFDLQKSR